MSIQTPTDIDPAASTTSAAVTPGPTAAHCSAHAMPPVVPPVVYLLADHLDAVLARGEDLLACSWRPGRVARCPASIAEHQDMQRELVRAIRTHEMLLVSRALKARERARELASKDGRFAPLARVFAAATASLEDAAREAGDMSGEHFDTGHGILAYMRGRGMVAMDRADLDDCGAIVVTPKFQVARRIELESILDLVATFLDTLELHFDIYPDAEDDTVDQPLDAPPAELCGAESAAAQPVVLAQSVAAAEASPRIDLDTSAGEPTDTVAAGLSSPIDPLSRAQPT